MSGNEKSNNQIHFKNAWVIYGAALWALLFAVLHVAWAAGWYIGLDVEQARAAFQQTWFWAYDLIAAVMCALGAIVALAILRTRKQGLPHTILNLLLFCGTGLLVLRGTAGIIKIIYLAANGHNVLESAALWDFWFCLGAILFCLAIWQIRRIDYSR